MSRIVKILAIVFAGVFIPVAAMAAPSCMVGRALFLHGEHNNTTMIVRSGKRCSITSNSLGPTSSRTITERPKNGTAQVYSTGVTYTPKARFQGQDQFTYRVRGNKAYDNSPYDYTVTINVTVSP